MKSMLCWERAIFYHITSYAPLPSHQPSHRPSFQSSPWPSSQPTSSPSFSPSYASRPSLSAQPSSQRSISPPSLRASNNLVASDGIPIPSSLGFWLTFGIIALIVLFIATKLVRKVKRLRSGKKGDGLDFQDDLDMIENQVTYVIKLAQPTPETSAPAPIPPPKRKDDEKKKQTKHRRNENGGKFRGSRVIKEHRHIDQRRTQVQNDSRRVRRRKDLWKMHVQAMSTTNAIIDHRNRDVQRRRDSYRDRDDGGSDVIARTRSRSIGRKRKPSRDRIPGGYYDRRRARSADRCNQRKPSPPRKIDDEDQSSATRSSEGERAWFSMFNLARNDDESEYDRRWSWRKHVSDRTPSRDRNHNDRSRRSGKSADRSNQRKPFHFTKTHSQGSNGERTWFDEFNTSKSDGHNRYFSRG